MSSSRRRPRGFTLIELLTVIAIIGVLTSLVLVSIGQVRESAKKARCVANLRGLGPAFMAFANDNKGRYPLGFDRSSNASNSWFYHLAPYLGKKAEDWPSLIAACKPGGPLGCLGTDPADSTMINAWMSYKMTDRHRQYLVSKGYPVAAPAVVGLPVNLIKSPAQSLLVAEGRGNPTFQNPTDMAAGGDRYYGLLYPHGGKTNALFADGHVLAMTKQEAESRWTTVYDKAVGN